MLIKNTILDKYYGRPEIKDLKIGRALAIIQQIEMWEGNLYDKKRNSNNGASERKKESNSYRYSEI